LGGIQALILCCLIPAPFVAFIIKTVMFGYGLFMLNNIPAIAAVAPLSSWGWLIMNVVLAGFWMLFCLVLIVQLIRTRGIKVEIRGVLPVSATVLWFVSVGVNLVWEFVIYTQIKNNNDLFVLIGQNCPQFWGYLLADTILSSMALFGVLFTALSYGIVFFCTKFQNKEVV
jgi:hypothetical protein